MGLAAIAVRVVENLAGSRVAFGASGVIASPGIGVGVGLLDSTVGPVGRGVSMALGTDVVPVIGAAVVDGAATGAQPMSVAVNSPIEIQKIAAMAFTGLPEVPFLNIPFSGRDCGVRCTPQVPGRVTASLPRIVSIRQTCACPLRCFPMLVGTVQGKENPALNEGWGLIGSGGVMRRETPRAIMHERAVSPASRWEVGQRAAGSARTRPFWDVT